jgi:hypothetical protein
VLTHPGGVGAVAVAADTGEVVLTASAMPGAADAEADAARRKRRKEAGVTAILHEATRCGTGTATSGPPPRTCSGPARCPPSRPPGTRRPRSSCAT